MGANERVVGGAPKEPGWGGGDDGGENPSGAGRVCKSRPGCGGATRASSAEGGGWLPGTVTSRCRSPAEAAALPPARGTQASRQAAPAPPPALGPTAWRVGALGAPQPRGPRPLPLRPLPAAQSRAARLAGPAPGWGRGSATESGDGPPSGHRAAPRGLTDREDRRRWVWAERAAHWGSPGCCGGGEGLGGSGALELLWAEGSPGELLPTRAFWPVLDPPPPNHHSSHVQEPRLDVKLMPQCLPADSVGTMASLMPLSPYLSPTVLLLVSCDLGFVRAGESSGRGWGLTRPSLWAETVNLLTPWHPQTGPLLL